MYRICLLLVAFCASTLFSQTFIDDDLNYFDFPLNSDINRCKASDIFENDWYKFSFYDATWKAPVEKLATYYPPEVWSIDPNTTTANTECYLRSHCNYRWGAMGAVAKVKIMIYVNDDFQLYFNENLIAEDLNNMHGPICVLDVTNLWREDQPNLIAIKAINTAGTGVVRALLRIYIASISPVTKYQQKIDNFDLQQNYPNPFNPETKIGYTLPNASYVQIDIYNGLGQKIKTYDKGKQLPGTYEVLWDGTDESGLRVSTGNYFYSLRLDDKVETKKMLFIK